MRVANWNPKRGDSEIIRAAMDRLEMAANLIADRARQKCPVGKVLRPRSKNGKEWSEREPGALKKSIRVVRLHGDPRLNIRIYAGSHKVFYARFVEMGTSKMAARPFLRPALNGSRGEARQILLNGGK
jgi:HK97 gp10 family phage protein